MKVALASTSAVKVAACEKAFARFYDHVEIVTFKAPSGVSEQPIDLETLNGAFNRLAAIKKAIPDAEFYVAIENGLFQEGGKYVDRAIAVVAKQFTHAVMRSDGVAFPTECVEEAKRRGFDQWTVGKVMAEKGVVKQHDDPHLDLSGKSRASYIDDALNKALKKYQPQI